MRDSPGTDILAGIKAYLKEHFPGVEFKVRDDAKTHSVILEAEGRPRYRLEVTARFLDGADGATKSLAWVHDWNVAEVLREAGSNIVTLATTGLHTHLRPSALRPPPRR
jgi:hypothetical protein